MRHALKIVTAIAASASVVASTTAIAAAAPPASQAMAAQTVRPQQPDAWLMLSALSPATAPIVQADALAAAQAAPPPRAEAVRGELLPFLLWFGLIVVALTIAGSSGRGAASGGVPNTPG